MAFNDFLGPISHLSHNAGFPNYFLAVFTACPVDFPFNGPDIYWRRPGRSPVRILAVPSTRGIVMQRRSLGASVVLAFLGGVVIGCGQTEQPAKPPPANAKAMQEQQQKKMQESRKEYQEKDARLDQTARRARSSIG
jgi:hypothetical protein